MSAVWRLCRMPGIIFRHSRTASLRARLRPRPTNRPGQCLNATLKRIESERTLESLLVIGVIFVAALASLLALAWAVARCYRKAGPTHALLVYGARGTCVVQQGGKLIIPMLENCVEISLAPMTI